jgi:hypothetical protein
MHTLALIYLLLLATILAVGVKSPQLGWLRAALAVFLLVWAVLILTAQFLSLFSALNVTWLYIGVSIAIAAIAAAGLRKIRPTHKFYFPEFESPLSPRVMPWIMTFLIISATLVITGNLMLAKGFLPANPDSIVYRLPRVYWYFSHGSMAHFSNQGEPRPQFYPFNGAIAYLPLLHFQLGPRSFSLMSLLCWLMAGLSTYVFARDLGGPRVVAAATAWTILLTPNVLIQSLSTNDELIAAAPFVAGLFFLHRWYHARQPFDALIGVIGLAISVGTKVHATFYMPLFVVIAAVLAWHHRAVWAEVQSWRSLRGAAFVALLASIVLVFTFSFLIYNYQATGQMMPWDFAAQVQNKPFNVFSALQNIVLQTSRVVLTPVADLHLGSPVDSQARNLHYQAFNALVAPLFTWVNNGPAFVSAGYRFTGINTAESILFNEQTVYIGFTWVVWLLSGIWLASRWREPQLLWARFHAASFPVWVLTYAATWRYVEGFAVYLDYATVVMAPVMVYAFAPIKRARLAHIRLGVLAGVAATHAFFAASILYTSPSKSLAVLAHTPVRPISRGFAVDQSITDEIGRANSGVYHHTIAWGQPYWAFMAFHPEIKHFLASQPNVIATPERQANDHATTPQPDSSLHVYSFPQFPIYGHAVPIRIPGKASPGLTWIGNLQFAFGPEWGFAAGNGVAKRFLGRDNYIVVRYAVPLTAEPSIRITPPVFGLGSNDDLKFRFDVKIDGKVVSSSDWKDVLDADLATPGIRPGNAVLTMYVRNDNAGGAVYSTEAILESAEPPRMSTRLSP